MVFAQSPFSTTGCATAIGEQPVKDCCEAMGRLMVVNGGKDSLLMTTKVGEEEVKVTRMIVNGGEGGQGSDEGAGHVGGVGVRWLSRHGADGHVDHLLVFVDLSAGHARLSGSALAQVFKQLGDAAPDCDTALLKRAFRETQRLLRERVLLAGRDRSDGGLLTTVLEM